MSNEDDSGNKTEGEKSGKERRHYARVPQRQTARAIMAAITVGVYEHEIVHTKREAQGGPAVVCNFRRTLGGFGAFPLCRPFICSVLFWHSCINFV